MQPKMSLANLYEGREIFITGGSGFIGKPLIEKILRSLPGVEKIYVLLRAKKGKSAEERLKQLMQDPVFQRVRDEQPDAVRKVIAIPGDCQDLGLDISSTDLEKIRNVSIIFHVAATVRFDEYLKSAILLNVRGTRELVKIAQNLSNLRAFIHVSTAYSHPDLFTVEEKIYPAYADWRTTIELAETYDNETLNILFPKYAPGHPNTYTFTKSLAEHIINDHRHKMPMAILRPSIVFCAFSEPVPGWIDNFNGIVGMLLTSGMGINHTAYGNPDIVPDIIPVDVVVKSLLVSACKLAATQPKAEEDDNGIVVGELEIFNCCNSSKRYLSTNGMLDLCKDRIRQNPFDNFIWFPEGSMTRCRIWHYYRCILLHIIPALLLDALMCLSKRPPFLLKLQRRILTSVEIFKWFLNNEWDFINDNFRTLENLLTNTERSTFSFLDYCDCDQSLYFENATKGAKTFLLKEKPEASRWTLLRLRIFWILHYVYHYYIAKKLLTFLYTKITSV